MDDLRDEITITKVECHKTINNDFKLIKELFVKLDEAYGFNYGECVIVLRYLDFPDIIEVNKISELKKRIESQLNSTKRVKELTMKLASMKEYYQEQLNELKALHDLQISNLEIENKYFELYEFAPVGYFSLSENGIIKNVNLIGAELFNVEKEYLLGTAFVHFIDKNSRSIFYRHLKNVFKTGSYNTCELVLIKEDGIPFNAHLKTVSILEKDGNLKHFLTVVTDITNLKQSENKLEKTLEEKELLIQEIHHRVKNNLQIISSMLDLQESYVKENVIAVNVLQESQNRVSSMAMLHEMLYQSNDINQIDFYSYIIKIVSNLFDSYNVNNRIKFVINADNIFLNMETAVPCGLIISELISNSLKYAYPNDNIGELNITLQSIKNKLKLIISDDGVGFPEDLDFRNINSSLGLKLVNALVMQLHGTIELDRSQGTEFIIEFKALEYKKRV